MDNNNKTIEIPCITIVSSGAIPVITMFCRTAKIGEIVNQMVYCDTLFSIGCQERENPEKRIAKQKEKPIKSAKKLTR